MIEIEFFWDSINNGHVMFLCSSDHVAQVTKPDPNKTAPPIFRSCSLLQIYNNILYNYNITVISRYIIVMIMQYNNIGLNRWCSPNDSRLISSQL